MLHDSRHKKIDKHTGKEKRDKHREYHTKKDQSDYSKIYSSKHGQAEVINTFCSDSNAIDKYKIPNIKDKNKSRNKRSNNEKDTLLTTKDHQDNKRQRLDTGSPVTFISTMFPVDLGNSGVQTDSLQ